MADPGGNAVLDDAGGWFSRLGVWLAPMLLLLYLRYYLEPIGVWLAPLLDPDRFRAAAQVGIALVALAAGAVLLRLWLQPWNEMRSGSMPQQSPAMA